MTMRMIRTVTLLVLATLAGCAPDSLGPAECYYADQYQVRDASVRRTQHDWYLRFDALLMSDLDDAINAGSKGNDAEMRRLADQVIRGAVSLAQSSVAREIQRMPAGCRTKLARLDRSNQPSDTPDALIAAYQAAAQHQGDALRARLQEQSSGDMLLELKRIRGRIEPPPDDKGRLGRQVSLAWAAAPAWIGLEQVESDLENQQATPPDLFDTGVTYPPTTEPTNELLDRHAPLLIVEQPAERSYPADVDRFGEVYLDGSRDNITVHINPSRPLLYAYRSEAKIHGTRYPQVVYTWWFPERPAMIENDPVAGHIDGGTLRITLDSQGRPAIVEAIQSCGCGHLLYVSNVVENATREQCGGPLPDKKLAVESSKPGRRDLYVMGTFDATKPEPRLVVYLRAGYHTVSTITCTSAGEIPDITVAQTHQYRIVSYDLLEHLPLGDGYASMFGPDGLVHNAGRREGYLLAPTGIMSAGQPRQRGTQKIRWDEYSFDDPTLLEHTLRLPKEW